MIQKGEHLELLKWMTDAAQRSVTIDAPGLGDQDGRLLFEHGPKLGKLLEGTLPNKAIRLTLFRPIDPASRIFLLSVEFVASAGETFDGLTIRQTRNEARRLRGLGSDDDPFQPDPRFVILTRPSERPDPIALVKEFHFPSLFGKPDLRQIAEIPALQVPTDPTMAWSLETLLDRIAALGTGAVHLGFRSRNRLLGSVARVTVDHHGLNPAPRLDYDVATETGLIFEDPAHAQLRPYRHSVRVFRFNEPPSGQPSSSSAQVYMPADYRCYLIDLVFLTTKNSPFLTVRDIPAIPLAGGPLR